VSELLYTAVNGPRDAPAVVLVGSLGTTGEMWAPQCQALADQFRVIAIDHRGQGRSPVPPGPYTMADFAADVVHTLDHLGITTFSYAGLSMGGTVGIALAATAGERVKSLALLCTSAYYGNPGNWRQRAETVRAKGTGAIAEAVVARWFTARTARTQPALVARHRQMLIDSPDEGYAYCCEALAAADLRESLPTIRCHTLVVAGGADPSTPEEPHARTIASGIPGSRLVVLSETAHLANAERPAEVTDLLRRHFAAND
jgi:3-oxoadipate enol-lactonase